MSRKAGHIAEKKARRILISNGAASQEAGVDRRTIRSSGYTFAAAMIRRNIRNISYTPRIAKTAKNAAVVEEQVWEYIRLVLQYAAYHEDYF